MRYSQFVKNKKTLFLCNNHIQVSNTFNILHVQIFIEKYSRGHENFVKIIKNAGVAGNLKTNAGKES